MNIPSSQYVRVPKRQDLPALPQPPNGKGPFKADISFIAPDTIDTRLGSIPADYTSYLSGSESGHRFRPGEAKEATNRNGDSTNIWRKQPQYNADGSVKMHEVTQSIEAKTYSRTGKTLAYGAVGAALGGLAGGVVGYFLGDAGTGAAVGATTVGGVFGATGFQVAKDDRVRLEWQETPVKEFDLQGYSYDRDENEDDEGNTEDYDHEFRPIIAEKQVAQYFRPVVVHYDKDDPTKGGLK